jgi:hypothetical protein
MIIQKLVEASSVQSHYIAIIHEKTEAAMHEWKAFVLAEGEKYQMSYSFVAVPTVKSLNCILDRSACIEYKTERNIKSRKCTK